MKKDRLSEILATFHGKEIDQLTKFVNSPYHNDHEGVLRLYHYLKERKFAPVLIEEREEVYALVFDDESYDDKKWRHVRNYLLNVVRAFLANELYKKDKARLAVELAVATRKKGVLGFLEDEFPALERRVKQQTNIGVENYHYRYQLGQERYNLAASKGRPQQVNIEEVSSDLDAYYAISKLRIACNAINHRSLFKGDHKIELLPEVLALIEGKDLEKQPLLKVYYHAYYSLSEQSAVHFEALKETLLQNTDTFESGESKDLFLLAINFCIRQLNNGQEEYMAQVFDLYQQGIAREILTEKGKLTPFTYKNVVSSGIRLGELDATEQFITTYKDKLTGSDADGIYAFNLAKLHFEKKHFHKTIEVLNSVKIKDLFTDLGAKVLLIKAFYELDEWEYVPSLIDNFRQLLGRKEVLTYHRTNYSNFVRAVNRLTSLRENDDKAKERYKKWLAEQEVLTERKWLVEKAK